MVVLSEVQQPISKFAARDDCQMPIPMQSMHLQQHHFMPSPTLHHVVNANTSSLGRKAKNGVNVRSYQRLSTFRPLHGQPADLIRECIEDRLTVNSPTYETIDPHHLRFVSYDQRSIASLRFSSINQLVCV